jgi:hypothetical protein
MTLEICGINIGLDRECNFVVVTEVDGEKLCADHAHELARTQAKVDFDHGVYAPNQFQGEFRGTYDMTFGEIAARKEKPVKRTPEPGRKIETLQMGRWKIYI